MSKIPPYATCVFNGIIFDIYQWQQQLYDGTSATFEMARRSPTVVVLALDGKDIIFTKQEQPNKPEPYYALLGGRAEENEDPLLAAKRELLEESGMEGENWKLLRSYSLGGKLEWPVYYFVAHNCRKVAEPCLDGGEKVELIRMPFRQFLTDILPLPNFAETELKGEIMSAFNNAAVDALCAEVTGE